MKTLHLNLKKEWFDMILSGEKKEEYRELTDYWKKRFSNAKAKGIKHITFSNGYAKDRRQMIVLVRYIRIGTGVDVWGAEKNTDYFCCILGDITETKNC